MMAKRRKFEPDADYRRERAFVLAVAAFVDSLPPAPIPTPRINSAQELAAAFDEAEARGARVARTVLRVGLQDLLELSREFSPPQIADLNAQLSTLDLPSLAAMRDKVWKTVSKVLARGRIRDDAEYYLLVERLDDDDDPTTPPEARARLARIIDEYEQRQVKRRPPSA